MASGNLRIKCTQASEFHRFVATIKNNTGDLFRANCEEQAKASAVEEEKVGSMRILRAGQKGRGLASPPASAFPFGSKASGAL